MPRSGVVPVTEVTGANGLSSIAVDGSGNLTVAWSRAAMSTTRVWARRFAPPAPPPPHPQPNPPGGIDGGSGDSGPPLPDNAFTLGELDGKKLSVTVPGPGVVEVTDAADQHSRRASAAKRKKKLLKPSSATATAAGTVTVKLKLTRTAKKALKKKGKVKVKAAVTFTPTGGIANTDTERLKVKK